MIATALLAFVLAQAPSLVKNPRTVEFTCPDHAADDQHELDIVRSSDDVVIQTILLGDPQENAQGTVSATINVQPIAFGQYYARVRAISGSIKSDNSTKSNDFVRSPLSPANVNIK